MTRTSGANRSSRIRCKSLSGDRDRFEPVSRDEADLSGNGLPIPA
jgi:hypothetical protein